jgi:phosphatidate cytidylyltransferase
MEDFHSINESINQKAGRKLLPSILVSLSILGIVFGALKINTNIFMVFVWIAMLLANREIVRAYSRGGIQIPLSVLLIANTGLLAAAWWGKVSGLAVATAFAIPNVMVSILVISSKDFVKRSTAAVFAIFYIPFLAGFILLLAKGTNPIGKI